MRRDLSGEVLIALIVIGTLGLALAFGLLLTISQTARPTTTPAMGMAGTTVSAAAVTLEMPTEMPTRTPTEIAPSRGTASPTNPATATATATRPSASPTPPPTASQTIAPSAMGRPFATFTVTTRPTQGQSPTASITRTFTATATATGTARVSASPSRQPSATASRTIAATLRPSDTITATPPESRTPTAIPTATPTVGIRFPTAVPLTPTFPPLIIASLLPATPTLPIAMGANATPCQTPPGWAAYIVRAGDTLFGLAARAGVSMTVLVEGNCLGDGRLRAGAVIALPPRFFRVPTATPLPPIPSPEMGGILPGVNVQHCTTAGAKLYSPRPGSTVRGTLILYGEAIMPNFAFYKIELSTEGGDQLWNVGTSPTPVSAGILGTVDTSLFAPGVYWLTLTVVDQTSSYLPPCMVRVALGGGG